MKVPVGYLHELSLGVSLSRPVHPAVDVFKVFDEIHKDADNPVEMRVDQVKGHYGVLAERTHKDAGVRLLADNPDGIFCTF